MRAASGFGSEPTENTNDSELAAVARAAWLGRMDEARAGAERVRQRAFREADHALQARALAVLGEIALDRGELRAAAALFEEGLALGEVGIPAEIVRVLRIGVAEASAESGLLGERVDLGGSQGATGLDLGAGDPFRWRLARVRAKERAGRGEARSAAEALEALANEARAAGSAEDEWIARYEAARLHGIAGDEGLAQREARAALERLEALAMPLTAEERARFFDDPRRGWLRERARSERRRPAPENSMDGVPLRLMDILKRLASEHDLERLLERITDAAIELSGAERGFVLLEGSGGELEPRLVRSAGTSAEDPSVPFSRSIAEAVRIDGAPILTIDARDDRRLLEYLSVHQLMLRSVACVPIRGRGGVIGVLYLEDRLRPGRFGENALDLLLAFADQAAIALENAALVSELEGRKGELERANADLEAARLEIARLLETRTAELESTRQELDRTRGALRSSFSRHGIVGRSEGMRRVFAVIDRVREADVPVVIYGESGTGKELIARAIHYGGPRASKPFVAINCGAIPEALLESELFGYVRGAFTGADRPRRGLLSRSSGGTLLLDEVGDMPPKMQVDLLRVLQEGKVRPVGSDDEEDIDVRILAASNKNLAELVKQGRFRADLYYRLQVVEVRLPALRDRAEDIPLLCEHFLSTFAGRDGLPRKKLARDALERLTAHPLPGNVRQLEHLLLNACVMGDRELIEADDLALGATEGKVVEASPAAEAPRPMARSWDQFKATEKQRILDALEESGWNRARAAKVLGIPRRTFYRRLREYGVL